MNKFIKTTSSLTKSTLTVVLLTLVLSSCALLNKGIVIPTPTEGVRG